MHIKTPKEIRYVNNIKCDNNSLVYCLTLYELNKHNIEYERKDRCGVRMYEQFWDKTVIEDQFKPSDLVDMSVNEIVFETSVYINVFDYTSKRWIYTSGNVEKACNLLLLSEYNNKQGINNSSSELNVHYTLITQFDKFVMHCNPESLYFCGKCNCKCKDYKDYTNHVDRCVNNIQEIPLLNTEQYSIQRYLNREKTFTQDYVVVNSVEEIIKQFKEVSSKVIFVQQLSSEIVCKIIKYAKENNMKYSFDRITNTEFRDIKINDIDIRDLQELFPYLPVNDRTYDNISMIRKELMREFNIDILNYVSIASYSYQCLLKTVKQLPTMTENNREAFEFMMQAYHGGYTDIFCRYYDKPSFCLDAVSLYPSAGCYKLPVGEYKFIKPPKRNFNKNLLTLDVNDEYGYFVEVDYIIPEKVRESIDCYPLTRHNVNNQQIADTYNHEHYVDHIMNIQLMIRQGYEITAVHKILKYKQESILKPYFERVAKLRADESNVIMNKTYKILMNSVYGMLLRKPQTTSSKIVSDIDEFNNIFKDPTKIKSFEVCEEGLLVEIYNPNNRYMYPIQLGITLLAISRYLMGSFIHEKLKLNIKNFKMLYTATDSIFATGDNYKEYLDTLPQNNKLGEFKIVEDNITEFIALQSKVYAYKTNDHVVTKGSAFSFEDYKHCLFEGIEKSNQYVRYDIKGNVNIRNKILLSNKWNNSRKLLEDGINTVSHH